MKVKFIEVKCKECDNVQTIYAYATQSVKCLKCNKEFTKPSTGKCELINCKITKKYGK